MPVIKRYPNRKLYDTEAKSYITLEGVAELIWRRKDVEVFDHVTGSGGTPAPGDVVTAHYTGWLENGCIFDSSYISGKPGSFGLDRLIPGWAEGVRSMQAGGRRRIEIPPHLAYGTIGFPGVIPPNSTLVFEVELVSFATPTPTPEPQAEPGATPAP